MVCIYLDWSTSIGNDGCYFFTSLCGIITQRENFLCQKIKNLLAENEGRIYVYLKDKEVANQFMIDAENEGFTFSDGKKLTERKPSDIMAINKDNTINFVGTVGYIAYQSANKIGEEPLIKIDYSEVLQQSK